MADIFSVIADATRRDILLILLEKYKLEQEISVSEIVTRLETSQPTVSKHLKVLREAQLVSMRAQGQKRYYALNRGPLEGISQWLETFDVGSAATAAPAARGAQAKPAAAARLASGSAAAPAPAEGRGPTAAGPDRAAADAVSAGVLARDGAELSPAVVIPGGTAAGLSDDTMPQQIGRSVGRAATKAADLLANLPKFGRKK